MRYLSQIMCSHPLCYQEPCAKDLCAEHLNSHQRAEYAALLMSLCDSAPPDQRSGLLDRVECALRIPAALPR